MVCRHPLQEKPQFRHRHCINSHCFVLQPCLWLIFTLVQDAFQEDITSGRGRGLSTHSNFSPQRSVQNSTMGQPVSGRVLGKDVEENTETSHF